MLKSQSVFSSIDEIQREVFEHLLNTGRQVAPRGIRTLESMAISFELSDPRSRCVSSLVRKWSLPLAIGELSWHLSGSDIASEMGYYAPVWNSLADVKGKVTGSCYGSKLFSRSNETSVWQEVKDLLVSDPDSRRAVVYFADSTANAKLDCLDVACTTSLQFLLRENRLDAIVSMRSNDAVWGLPYDIFLFTFLQEMMSVELKVELGSYIHFAGSLHIYERHWKLAERVLASDMNSNASVSMPPLPDLQGIEAFLAVEKALRLNEELPNITDLPPYWKDLARVLHLYRNSKHLGWKRTLDSADVPFRYRRLLSVLAT